MIACGICNFWFFLINYQHKLLLWWLSRVEGCNSRYFTAFDTRACKEAKPYACTVRSLSGGWHEHSFPSSSFPTSEDWIALYKGMIRIIFVLFGHFQLPSLRSGPCFCFGMDGKHTRCLACSSWQKGWPPLACKRIRWDRVSLPQKSWICRRYQVGCMTSLQKSSLCM